MSQHPAISLRLPTDLADQPDFERLLLEVMAGILGDTEVAPESIVTERSADDTFTLGIGNRPAVVGLPLGASDIDAELDEIALRLLRRLNLWRPDLGPRGGINHYLTQLGMAPEDKAGALETGELAVRQAERHLADHAPELITVEVPATIARNLQAGDLEAMVRLRKNVFQRTGVDLPDVDVIVTEPELRRLRFRLNGVIVTVRHVAPDSSWGDVVDHLSRVLEPRLHWFLRQEQIESALDDLWYLVPDLVDACRKCYPLDVLTACLRELVRHGESLRNLNRILWLLLDLGTTESDTDHLLMAESPLLARTGSSAWPARDPVALASRIRKCIRDEAWRVGVPSSEETIAARLSSDLESALRHEDGNSLAAAEWRAIQEYADLGRPDTILVRSVAAIEPVFDALQALPDPPQVIAAQELAPDADLSTVLVAGGVLR